MGMQKKLHFLFVSLEGVGHINACTGVGQVLRDAGHRITFVITDQWRGKIIERGFEELVITLDDRPKDADPSAYWSEVFVKAGSTDSQSTLHIIQSMWRGPATVFIQDAKNMDPILGPLFKQVKPDVIVIDQVVTIPSVEASGIPWINCCSFNPLFVVDDERTPPMGSGFAIDSDRTEWTKFREAVNKTVEPLADQFNEYIVSLGLPAMQKYKYFRHSPFLNIYGFPLELDYTDVRPNPPNWCRFDNLKRTEVQTFEIPNQLSDKPGKLIYFSMGTMGSANVGLMKRLIGILANSEHRFIVSKGPNHNQIDLADNMWGQQSVPQIQVLPVVDLFITHGGNNSLTESFFFGKPLIVMPVFGDQHDNAQRVHEKGFGLKLDPHKCTKEELLNGIDNLLNDKELNEKLKNISKRIQTENSIAKLPELVEKRLDEWHKN